MTTAHSGRNDGSESVWPLTPTARHRRRHPLSDGPADRTIGHPLSQIKDFLEYLQKHLQEESMA